MRARILFGAVVALALGVAGHPVHEVEDVNKVYGAMTVGKACTGQTLSDNCTSLILDTPNTCMTTLHGTLSL